MNCFVLLFRNMLFVCLLTFPFFSIRAQDYIQYFRLVNEAEYWLEQHEYKYAEELYLKAFDLEQPIWKDCYLLAKCYAYQGDKDRCYQYLQKCAALPISVGHAIMRRYDQRDVFGMVFEDPTELEAVAAELAEIKAINDKEYKNEQYTLLSDQLEEWINTYNAVSMPQEGVTVKPEDRKATHQKIISEFLAFIQDEGYPGYYRIGTDIGSILLSLVASKEKWRLAFQPVLEKALHEGELIPYYYGDVLEKQGTSAYVMLDETTTAKQYPILIKNRLVIGMSIFYKGTGRTPLGEKKPLPWIDEDFLKKYSLLDRYQ